MRVNIVNVITKVSSALALGLALIGACVAADPVSNATLTKLFDDERAAYYAFEVLAASSEGVVAYNDRMPSVTPGAQVGWQTQVQAGIASQTS